MKQETKKIVDRLRDDCKDIIEDCENEDPFFINESEKESIGMQFDTGRGHLAACDICMSAADINSWINSYFAFHSLDHRLFEGSEQELCDAAILLRAAVEKLEKIYEHTDEIPLETAQIMIVKDIVEEYVKHENFLYLFLHINNEKKFIDCYKKFLKNSRLKQ